MNNLRPNSGCSQSRNIFYPKDPPIFFFIMRFNNKIAMLFLISFTLFAIVVLYSMCNTQASNLQSPRDQSFNVLELQSVVDIHCDINGEYSIGCKKDDQEVYVPVTFLKKYFEIYGELSSDNRFEWSHSYSKVYHPKTNYDPRGVYMYFENYNVEVRERVKCVSATDGVPVSTQWESQGYYYPTQIAQFGLSHYSKNLTEPEPRIKLVEDADEVLAQWAVPESANLQRGFTQGAKTKVLHFKTSENYNEGIHLKMDHVLSFVLKVDLLLSGNSSFTVALQNRENKEVFFLHYIVSDILITTEGSNIYHGIGLISEWKRLTRDLIVDLQKGLNYLTKEKLRHKVPKSKLKVVGITLRGSGSFDNLTISSSEHMQQFYDAAEWFVKNQDSESGGWPIPVKRKIAADFVVLEPGWYSSMGQGHAISVLARAFHHSGGDQRYLNTALNGLKPFRVSAADGGVLATFLNKYHWYEEYPTQPASFVLNGFIFSLLGLYDLLSIAPVGQAQEAEFLYNQGITTLKNMLPLFDMGSMTAYDLRHFTLGIAPNLARWDYHATHVNQLLLLATIEDDPIFRKTADRWIGYMNGEFINKQWTRAKSSASNNLKSINNPDHLVEEEQETLPKEIDYLPSDKRSYLRFKKDGFNAGKSREDLTNILKNYNEEVLKNFVAKVDKKQMKNPSCLYNQSELVNYVTKIIVSKPKYHIRHCKCQVGDRRDSEVPGTCSVAKLKNQKNGNKSASGDTILSQKPIDLKASAEHVTIKVQTNPWNQIGSSSNCPGNESKTGKTVDTQTSANETLLKIHQFNPSKKKNEKKKEAEPILSDTTVTEMTSFSDGKTSNKQNYFKIRNETQNRRSTEPKSRHTAKEYAYESESRRQGKKEDCQTLPDSGTAAEVSPCSSKEESKLSFKKDVAAKGDKKAQGSPKNAKRKMKSKKEIICNKCRRLKRGYDSGGHNNIIVSNYPQSHGTVLIKMQSKDSTREFDRIMAELNYQKSEIERLNDMYQKMIKSKESQKFTGSRLLSAIYKDDKRPNSIQREASMESKKGHVSLLGDTPMASSDEDYYEEGMQISKLQSQANGVDADIETDTSEPQMKEAKWKFKSRVLMWLKKSWINLKHKSEECRRNCKGKEAKVYISQVFSFCQNTAKGAAMGTWKFVKKKFQ